MRSPFAVLSVIADRFLPAEGMDEVQKVRARFFVFGSTAIATAIAGVSAVYAASPGVDLKALLPVLALLLPVVASPFLLRRGAPLSLLGGALIVLIQSGLAWSAVLDRGMNDVAFLWLVASPLFAALVGGARLAVLSVVTAVGGGLGVLMLAETGHVFPELMTPTFARRYQLINVAAAAGVVATFAWLYEGPLLTRANALAARLRTVNAELRHELAARRQAQASAEAASRAKDVLLANLSHEFRTPLTAVLAGLELLEEGAAEADRELLHSIGRGAHRLLATLTGVLGLVHAESDVSTALEPVDLTAMAESLAEAAEGVASEKGLRVVRALPDGPLRTRADPAALSQLMSLLMDNAIRFTPRGAVGVGVEGGPEGAEILLWDTGIGMEPAFIERATEPFVQASEGQGRTHEGLGLGLALAQRLAHSMGGTLTIESALGEGTTVRVGLPAVPEAAEAAAPDRPSAASTWGRAPAVFTEAGEQGETVRA